MHQHVPFSWKALEGNSDWWRTIIVVCLVLLTLVLSLIPFSLVLQANELVQQRGFDPSTFEPAAAGISRSTYILLLLLPFSVTLVALLYGARFIHQRPFTGFITNRPKVNWRRGFIAAVVWLIPMVLFEFLRFQFTPHSYAYTFNAAEFFPCLAVLLLLLPGQIAFEEIFMRGYLHQQLTLLFRRPWVSIVCTSVVFAALHFDNPEVGAFGPLLAMPYYAIVGAFLACIAVLDDGLELSLGVHFATNFFITVFVNQNTSAVPSASMFTVEFSQTPWFFFLFFVQVVLFCVAFAKTSRWNWRNFYFQPSESNCT